MALTVTTLTTVEELKSLEQEWLALLGRTEADLPFLWPDWVITWWEFFHQDRLVIRDSLHVKTVRNEAGELVAVVPLMLTERPSVGPLRVRSVGFLGADKYVTEQRGAIVDPKYEHDVAVALAQDIGQNPSWDWITWEGLIQGSELAKTFEQSMDFRWAGSQAGNILHLAPTWDVFKSKLKRNIKESLRHCYNSLERDGHQVQLEIATSPEEIAAALEIFFTLHSARAQQSETVRHPDRFADPIAREFLKQVCARLALRGSTRIFTLRVGAVPVASRVGFQLPHCLYLYYSGYDPQWSKYSVGTTILAEAIKFAIEAGIPRVHLSMGADKSKSRWAPETPIFHAAVFVKPKAASRAALRMYSWAHSDRGVVRQVRHLLGRKFE